MAGGVAHPIQPLAREALHREVACLISEGSEREAGWLDGWMAGWLEVDRTACGRDENATKLQLV